MRKGQQVSLVIKDHVIRYVQFKNSQKGLIYKSYGERYLPAGIIDEGKIVERDTFMMILEECVNDWKIKGKPLLFTVPDNSVVIRKVQIDEEIPDEEVKGHLYLELGETLHLPFDEPYFDTSIVGRHGGKKEVILVAAPEQIVNEYQDLLEEAKVKPVVADLSSLSLYRLYYHLDLAHPEDHLLSLQLSINSMNITIFYQHIPIFTRHVRLNIENGTWELKRDFEKEEVLFWKGDRHEVDMQLTDTVTELERIMNFYRFSLSKGKSQITKLLITGDHPDLLWFIAKCKESFDTPIQTMQDREIYLKNGNGIPSRFNEIVGLSLK
ncbi:type IV pilus biogenesis protein PilM [Bacillus salitolerans]|uniref:Type IV pilus biogenesis protein PilM n=1 Tax=Bacillus salitolerans TaxID=1437434 RepID=A0ABW4LLP3_9BACI